MFEIFDILLNDVYSVVLFAWMLFGADAPSMEALTVACPDPLNSFADTRACFERITLIRN